jgi:hypothetical protein
MEQNGSTWLGISEDGFKAAAKDAVAKYEEENGRPPEGEPVTLRVVELSVTVENPVRDYRVKLGQSG